MKIKPALNTYLREFNSCMGRVANRGHMETYITGQLSHLERKSIEPMADAAGKAPRTLQEFLSPHRRSVPAGPRSIPQPFRKGNQFWNIISL